MAIGITEAQTLGDSLNVMVAKARTIREQEGVMPQLVDKANLDEGTGLTWREISLSRLNDGVPIGEGQEFDQPFQLVDNLLTGTPTEVGGEVLITDRLRRRVDRKVLAQTGGLLGASLQRKKAKDGIVQLDSFSTSFGGAGTTFATGFVTAAAAQIEGNSTERGVQPMYTVMHRFQRRDIEAELAPVGQGLIPEGISAQVLRSGFAGELSGTSYFSDSVVAPDSLDDFKGGTFAKEGIVLVQGADLYTEEERIPGRRATAVFMFDEYIYIERADTMGVEQFFDATSPTS